MWTRCALLIVMASAGGCAKTYHWAYRYEPRPVTVSVTTDPASEARPVLVMATVVGVRTKSAKEHPASVEVRMRIENQTQVPASILRTPMELHSADLKSFGAPVISPAEALDAPPGQSSQFTAYFPFPAGKVPGGHDIDGLSLRWTLRLGEQELTRTATFSRREIDDYYDDRPRFGVGVGVGVHYFDHPHRHYHRHRHRR